MAAVDQWSAHGSTGDHNLFLLFSCHKHSAGTKSLRHHHLPPSSNFPFPLITGALWFSPCSPFRNRAVLIISARSWFTSPSPLSLSIMPFFFPVCRLSRTRPRFHLLSSYLLILPSVSIRADCCHFRPICPCISFSFSPSLLTTQLPLSSSIHLAPGKQTAAAALTPSGDGAVAEVG